MWQHHELLTRTLAAAILVAASSPAISDVRVGGFDHSRGGGLSLKSGEYLNTVRTVIPQVCGGPFVLSETNTLTPEYLGGIDVLIISSVRTFQTAISPLSAQEQASLHDFVLNGGGVIIFADNLNFGGHDPLTPNGSILEPFGFGIDGITEWPEPVTSIGPSPITLGVPTFNVLLGGILDVVPPLAQVLARRNTDAAAMLCAIPRSALSPGSGPVVIFADASLITDMFIVPYEGVLLVNNALAFASPEPVPCYANCDGNRCSPVLNANDFACFLNRFAAADPYANCDNSTTTPLLNANDFVCFLNRFAAGCQ